MGKEKRRHRVSEYVKKQNWPKKSQVHFSTFYWRSSINQQDIDRPDDDSTTNVCLYEQAFNYADCLGAAFLSSKQRYFGIQEQHLVVQCTCFLLSVRMMIYEKCQRLNVGECSQKYCSCHSAK